MDTIFVNSKSSKSSELYRLLLTCSIKKTLKEMLNMLLYQTLACTSNEKT